MGVMKKLYTLGKIPKPYIHKDENGRAEEVVDDEALMSLYNNRGDLYE